MATKKKAGAAKSKQAGKTSAKSLKDLNPKGDKKIKGGKSPRGLINFT